MACGIGGDHGVLSFADIIYQGMGALVNGYLFWMDVGNICDWNSLLQGCAWEYRQKFRKKGVR
jgi:hypothetical protein